MAVRTEMISKYDKMPRNTFDCCAEYYTLVPIISASAKKSIIFTNFRLNFISNDCNQVNLVGSICFRFFFKSYFTTTSHIYFLKLTTVFGISLRIFWKNHAIKMRSMESEMNKVLTY